MRKLVLFTLSATVLASGSAFAQELTRAEVTQQLVQAEQSGSRYVTESSYPDVSPVYSNQAARQRSDAASDFGGMPSGTSASGPNARPTGNSAPQTCVGPISFCNLYAGS
jgi:hypothetical protein